MIIRSDADFAIESDMLQGNITRICLTDDRDELDRMFAWAVKRLAAMREYREREMVVNIKRIPIDVSKKVDVK